VTRKATQRSRGMTRLAAARKTCVDGPELAWARRPLQHPELMAENEDLEVLGSVDSTSPSSADEETDEGADDEVEEGQHRPIVQGLSERESGFPTPTGCRPEHRRSGGRLLAQVMPLGNHLSDQADCGRCASGQLCLMHTFFSTVYERNASRPFSRPKPLRL